METLREAKQINGLGITCYKQNGAQIMCKILITPCDAIELCRRTKSGLYKNKEFHEMFMSQLVSKLEEFNTTEKEKFNGAK